MVEKSFAFLSGLCAFAVQSKSSFINVYLWLTKMKKPFFSNNLPIVLVADSLFFSLAWYWAFFLRFNFFIPDDSVALIQRTLPFVIVLKLLVFYFFAIYRGMWRYTSLNDLFSIIKASAVGSFILVFLVWFFHGFEGLARAIFIIDWVLVVFLSAGYRVGIRLYFGLVKGDEYARNPVARLFFHSEDKGKTRKKLLIIGAGDCGEKIYREIRDNASLHFRVVGFIDDHPLKQGRQIHGIPIVGGTGDIADMVRRFRVDEALIAIPSSSSAQMRAIVFNCKEAKIPFKTLPGMGELIDGRVSVKAIRDVAYRDLLGREVTRLEEDRIGGYLNNTRVLVTGAGGSIGSELSRQICRFKPETLILFERAESPLYDIEIELKKNFPFIHIIVVLGDIRDRRQLAKAFETHRPTVVFHAAAYKHVPMIELHPWKAIRNNIVGTRNLVEAAKEYHVNRFVLVSTDKAVRPTNVMGASKRVAELVVQGQNGCSMSATQFMMVRFGNVVGSVGSVIPLFKKQIEAGGPVTVTHPEMTRYFMTIPEASQLILQAGAMGQGGEIFILEMGTPVKIVDMAKDLIRLSGFEPEVDIPISFVGLRPGEKLYEELITKGEGIVATSHEKIMVLNGQACDQEDLNCRIDRLRALAYNQDSEGIKTLLKEIVPEYTPGK